MASAQKVQELYVDLQLRTAAFKQAMDDATAHTKKFSAQMRAEMQSSQAAVKILNQELGIGIPRALQGVIAKLPGVSAALSTAFNAIAILAVIDIVVKAGEKIAEFASKSEEAARKNKAAWQGINAPLIESNDELQVVNDKLAASIAKLEHKPQNGLKAAIDEAVVSADKLGDKLTEDLAKIQDALKGQSVGFMKTLFGQASTSDIEKKYADLQSRISDANTRGNQAIRSARDNGGDVGAAKKALQDELEPLYKEGSTFATDVLKTALIARKAQEDWAKGSPAAYSHPESERSGFNSQDMTARIASASGMLDFFGAQRDALNLHNTNDSLNKQNDVLTAQKESADAAKKAAADRLRSYETEYQQQKLLYGMTLSQETSFWNARLSSFTKGSQEYLDVLTKFATAQQAEGKYLSSVSKAYRDRTGTPPSLDLTKSDDSNAAAIARTAEQQASLRAQIAEVTTQYRLSIGAINEHDAAVIMAGAHAQEYATKIAVLTTELNKLRSEEMDVNGQNVDPANAAKQTQVAGQIAALQVQARISAFKDGTEELGTTWKGMVDSVFDELVRRSQQTTSQIKQIAQQTIDSINNELAKGITGHKTNFSAVADQAAQSLTKTGLQKLEGVGLQALGFGGGKKDGSSASKALYVQMVGGGSGGSSSIPGLGSFGGSSGGAAGAGDGSGVAGAATHGLLGVLNDSDFFSSLFGGKLFGGGSLFGGGFAIGGDVQAGVPIDVGEFGRERFVPKTNGKIIPNKDLKGGMSQIGYIDARGTDPVMVHDAVTRANRATYMRSVADATHAMAEHQRRTPK